MHRASNSFVLNIYVSVGQMVQSKLDKMVAIILFTRPKWSYHPTNAIRLKFRHNNAKYTLRNVVCRISCKAIKYHSTVWHL